VEPIDSDAANRPLVPQNRPSGVSRRLHNRVAIAACAAIPRRRTIWPKDPNDATLVFALSSGRNPAPREYALRARIKMAECYGRWRAPSTAISLRNRPRQTSSASCSGTTKDAHEALVGGVRPRPRIAIFGEDERGASHQRPGIAGRPNAPSACYRKEKVAIIASATVRLPGYHAPETISCRMSSPLPARGSTGPGGSEIRPNPTAAATRWWRAGSGARASGVTCMGFVPR